MKRCYLPFEILIVLGLLAGSGLAPTPTAAQPAGQTHSPQPEITFIEPNGVSFYLPQQAGGAASPDVTELTLGFYASFDPAYRPYVQDWFDAVIPAITAIIGEPYKSGKVCFRPVSDSSRDESCMGTITGAYPKISLPYNPSNSNDARWDNTNTHEMIHAHHSSVMPHYCVGQSCYGHWLDEGLTEASTWLVVEYALANGIRDMTYPYLTPASYIFSYDVNSLVGVEFWGGAPVPGDKLNPLDAYGLVAALFWLAATSQGSAGGEAAAEDWIDYDWFRRLNAVAYAWQRAHSGTEMTLDQFYQFVDQVSPLLMDNQALSVWMQAQPITHYGNPPGTYIGAFPTTVTNPSFVEIVVYTLDAGNPPQESMHVGQVDGSYTAYNYRGETLTSGDFQATNGHGLIYTQDLCSAGGGAYRVVLQANIESTLRTAQTAFLCASQDLTTDPDAGVGLILMDPDGTLFNGTITSGNSAVIYNAGGGAVLLPDDVSTLPTTIGVGFNPSSTVQASRPMADTLTLYLPAILRDWPPSADDWYYNLPLPYSRVIVAIRPDQ